MMVFNRTTGVYFSTSSIQLDKPTKDDNRRSLFLHRMQKKINQKDFEGALSVYRKLRSLRLYDHDGVFNKLFNLSIAQDDPAKLDQVLNEMQAANVQPIPKTLEILFPYLIQKDMRDDVNKLVDKMNKFNIIIREKEVQESLEEYLKRPKKELPKKEKVVKQVKADDEKPPKKNTIITNEKQLKKEIEEYLQSNDDIDGSLSKKKSGKSGVKRDKKEISQSSDEHKKKIIKSKSKSKKIAKEESKVKLENIKPNKEKKSSKKHQLVEEEEFDEEDELGADEVIETLEKKKKTKKISKTGDKKVKTVAKKKIN